MTPSTLYVTETVTLSCSCSLNAEQNKYYEIKFHNSTGSMVHNVSGTSPTTTAIFSGQWTVNSTQLNGVYNGTLYVLGTFKDSKTFTVTNATAFEKLQVTEIAATNITFGREASVEAVISAQVEGYATNALCKVSVFTPYNTIIDTKETTTLGGDGHLIVTFDTERWGDTIRPIKVGEEIRYYIECNCFSNCTLGDYQAGCCVGRVTDATDSKPITKYHFADTDIISTVKGNEIQLTGTELSGVLLSIFAVIALYLYLGNNWAAEIFKPKQSSEGLARNYNIMRLLFTWIGLWLMPLFLQVLLKLLEYRSVGTDLITLVTTLYQVSLWTDFAVSAFMVIYLVYNAGLYLATVFKRKA